MPGDKSFSLQRVFIRISLSLATRPYKNGVQTVAGEAAFQGVNGCAAHEWGQRVREDGHKLLSSSVMYQLLQSKSVKGVKAKDSVLLYFCIHQ